jgi:exodeoxyribonuclease V alpha subunit
MVALLVEQAHALGQRAPGVRLLAPTGKAAATLTAAFASQRDALDVAGETREAMACSAETVHRALHRLSRTDALGRAEVGAIDADLVVVDEASMVDLERMTRLFDACRDVDRVVLVGDPGQLASVESGAVLADLCGPDAADAGGTAPRALGDAVVTLPGSRRFTEGGGIGQLAEAIRAGDADRVVALLDDDTLPEVERCDVDSIDAVRARLVEEVRLASRRVADAASPAERLDRAAAHRVLCAHRRGPLGVDALCPLLDETGARARHASRHGGWWPGRMLLITQNAPDQDLWNGDVGLVDETDGRLQAVFPAATGGIRMLSAGRLPRHESAIAMSVHKSQGSEFDEVDLVLGASSSRLMTRELLYTGVTRARRRLRLHASETVVREAVARRVVRDSALAARLSER